jgi:hypothetical protein
VDFSFGCFGKVRIQPCLDFLDQNLYFHSYFLHSSKWQPFWFHFPGRGLRQGGPLSPFLFILGFEVLSRLLFKEERNGSIHSLRIARNCPAIHHLLFADDLLLFGKASVSVAASFNPCLVKYCRWSGQKINTSKSSIKFSKNISTTKSEALASILPYPSNMCTSLYLGLPILVGNSKIRAFQGIIDKVLGRIEGWKAKSLSQAGRLVLIKSVAAALPSYAMSSFLLPKSFCAEMDRIFKNFWWGFSASKTRNLTLKAWDSICKPKELGGLGLRKMREVNLALISKLGWNLLNKSDLLWCPNCTISTYFLPLFSPPHPILPPLGYGKASSNPLLSS